MCSLRYWLVWFPSRTNQSKEIIFLPMKCKINENQSWLAYKSFPRFELVTCFPALGTGYVFSCPRKIPAVGAVTWLTCRFFDFWLVYIAFKWCDWLSRSDTSSFNLITVLRQKKLTCFSFYWRSRPIVEMDGKIILSTTQISLEDNKTMRVASDQVLRKRYFILYWC